MSDTIVDARLAVHRAAAEWSPDAVRGLAYLVELGEPLAVLTAARLLTERGYQAGPIGSATQLPNTTDAQWATSGALAMWRDVFRAVGLKMPAPGSVHDSIVALGSAPALEKP